MEIMQKTLQKSKNAHLWKHNKNRVLIKATFFVLSASADNNLVLAITSITNQEKWKVKAESSQ